MSLSGPGAFRKRGELKAVGSVQAWGRQLGSGPRSTSNYAASSSLCLGLSFLLCQMKSKAILKWSWYVSSTT